MEHAHRHDLVPTHLGRIYACSKTLAVLCSICRFSRISSTVFASESNKSETPSEALFILQIVVLVVAGKLLGELMVRIGQPSIMGQLIAGIVLGPSVFGWMDFPGYSEKPISTCRGSKEHDRRCKGSSAFCSFCFLPAWKPIWVWRSATAAFAGTSVIVSARDHLPENSEHLRILIPVAGTERSLRAAEFALALTKAAGASCAIILIEEPRQTAMAPRVSDQGNHRDDVFRKIDVIAEYYDLKPERSRSLRRPARGPQ